VRRCGTVPCGPKVPGRPVPPRRAAGAGGAAAGALEVTGSDWKSTSTSTSAATRMRARPAHGATGHEVEPVGEWRRQRRRRLRRRWQQVAGRRMRRRQHANALQHGYLLANGAGAQAALQWRSSGRVRMFPGPRIPESPLPLSPAQSPHAHSAQPTAAARDSQLPAFCARAAFSMFSTC